MKHLQSNTDSNISGILSQDAKTLIYKMANSISQEDFNVKLQQLSDLSLEAAKYILTVPLVSSHMMT